MEGLERFVGSVSRRNLMKASALATVASLGGTATGTVAALPSKWNCLSLEEQLDVVRQATAPYRHLEAMDDAGYVSAALPLLCSEGYHFDKEAYWEDGVLDPERPESLFYMLNEDGNLTLGGAEFILVTELDSSGDPVDSKPDLFNDEDESLEGDTLRGTPEEDGWYLIEEPATGLVIWDLHVWVHEENPNGVFSLPNPRFADMPGCVPLDDVL